MKFETPPETDWSVLPALNGWMQIAVLGAILLFLLWRLQRALAGRRAEAKPCKWKKDRRGGRAGMDRWDCKTCGVDAFTQDGRAPKECKRVLRNVGL